MLNIDAPLDLDHAEADSLLGEVQGNILKGHGRLHTRLIFLCFVDDRHRCAASLKSFVQSSITSGLAQRKHAQAWRHALQAGSSAETPPLVSLAISRAGLEYLDALNLVPAIPGGEMPAFADIDESAPYSGTGWTPDKDNWDAAYRKNRPDLMLLIADDSEARLYDLGESILARLTDVTRVVAEEWGRRLIHPGVPRSAPIEHFGFRDGVSSPVMIAQDDRGRHELNEPQNPGGTHAFPRLRPLSNVLARERITGKYCFGSFLGFLKIEQNVSKYNERVIQLASALGVTVKHARALTVGRYDDGTPLVSKSGGAVVTSQNDFDYSEDEAGLDCPFHAHIRKVNGRFNPQFPQIVRRSAHYGPIREDLRRGLASEPPAHGVGMLFMAYQSAPRVFENRVSDTQQVVCPPFAGEHFIGLDALAGSTAYLAKHPVACGATQEWKKADGSTVRFDMSDFISLKGGDMYYVPSLPLLAQLGGTVSS